MKTISSKTLGALLGLALSTGLGFLSLPSAKAMDCDNQFMNIEDVSRFRSFQVESPTGRGNDLVDMKFQAITRINGVRELQMINRDGKAVERVNIDNIVRKHGDVLAVHVHQYWHGSNYMTNNALAVRGPIDGISMRWFNSRYLLKNEMVVVRTEHGLHFYQVYGQGRLGHWASTQAEPTSQIHMRTINFWSNGVQTMGTLTQVLEIRDGLGIRYFSPQFRRMLKPSEVGPIENITIN